MQRLIADHGCDADSQPTALRQQDAALVILGRVLHGIENRLTKPNYPWTNGQVERMNRTIKDATVKRYHYGSQEQLRTHLKLFPHAYNHARRLKTLNGLTPHEHVCKI